MPTFRPALALAGIASVLAGCVWMNTPELEQAARAVSDARSPLITEVHYEPADILGGEESSIDLVRSATEADAVELWCHVLEPLGAATPNTWIYFRGFADDGWQGPSDC